MFAPFLMMTPEVDEGITPVESPLDIPSCILWIEADVGITVDAGEATAIEDQSTQSNDFAAVDTDTYAEYVENELNGNPTLRSDGTAAYIHSNPSGWSGTAMTSVYVAEMPVWSGTKCIYNVGWNHYCQLSGGSFYWTLGSGAGAHKSTSFTAWAIISVVFDGTQADNASRLKVYKNGALWDEGDYGTVPSSLSDISSSEINFLHYDNEGNGWVGDWAYWSVHMTAMTPAVRVTLEAYLSNKYGIAVA